MNTEQPKSNGHLIIGFLGYRAFDKGEAFRGAILVTDEWSKPLEFRCTAPVRPTQLQRTLYGKSLLPHVLSELIGAPLIASVREKPQFILIADDACFDVRYKVSVPVIRVVRAGGTIGSPYREPVVAPVMHVDYASALKVGKQDDQSKSRSLLLQSASGKFPQVEIEAHLKFAADLASASERLRDLFGSWDLAEPFQRLAEGLQYVHDERVLES